MVGRRRDLRSRSTLFEEVLWQEIRNNKLGLRFKRQYSIMNFVTDFYCPKAKLVIEIDGGIHNKTENQKYDKYRTEYLKSLGIKEIRFTNDQVTNFMNDILIKIKSNLPSPKIRRGTEGEV